MISSIQFTINHFENKIKYFKDMIKSSTCEVEIEAYNKLIISYKKKIKKYTKIN